MITTLIKKQTNKTKTAFEPRDLFFLKKSLLIYFLCFFFFGGGGWGGFLLKIRNLPTSENWSTLLLKESFVLSQF